MANNEQNTIDADIKEGDVVAQQSTKSSKLVWILIALTLIISLGVSAWLYQQLQQQAKSYQTSIEQVDVGNAELAGRLQDSEQKVKFLLEAQQDLKVILNDVLQKQEYSSAELLAEWAVREVEFLLNVANQRAVLAKDVKGAKAALQMADKAIQDIADYRLHPLRGLISEEITQLDSEAKVDVAGLALQLQTAAKHVDQLRVKKGPEMTSQAEVEATTDVEQTSNWKTAINDVWQQVRSLVVIRHDDKGGVAVLAPEQRYFLYQNLKLQLESARLNLLNAHSEGYQQSLNTAVNWLETYFIGDERDAMLNTLVALQQENINVDIPDISASLQWIQEYQQ